MTCADNSTKILNKQTRLRLKLRSLGYTPLANLDKRCMLKGWPRLDVTEELIKSGGWARSRSYKATGLRIQDGLMVLDFDIDDSELTDLFAALREAFPELRHALRRGREQSKREAWFLRCDEDFNQIGSCTFKDRQIDGAAAHIEIFGSGSSRQFGAFENHSEGILYKWVDDKSPANVQLDELPPITKDQVLEIARFTDQWLTDKGFELFTKAGAGEVEPLRKYTLTDDMVFNVEGGHSATLADLRDGMYDSCTMSFERGSQAINPNRGIVGLDHEGGTTIWDPAFCITYHERQFKPSTIGGDDDLRKAVNELREAEGRPIETAPRIEMSTFARAQHLLTHYAFIEETGKIVRLDGDTFGACGISIKSFRDANIQWASRIMDGANLPYSVQTGMVNPIELWLASPDLIRLCGVVRRPDQAFPLCTIDGKKFKNVYKVPDHIMPQGGTHSADVFFKFMEKFIPDATERAWLLDALSCKMT